MKNKILLFTLLLCCGLAGFKAQTSKDQQQISKIVTDVLTGFKTKNADLINTYIYKEYGLVVLFQSGGQIGFVLNEDFDFSMPLGYIKPTWDIKNTHSITFNQSPNYDSGARLWRHEGLFVQENSNIINEYLKDLYSAETIRNQPLFKESTLAKNVVYVTLAENISNAPINGFRFVLTKIDTKWYLSFIDVTEHNEE